jgi:hypothetical protein
MRKSAEDSDRHFIAAAFPGSLISAEFGDIYILKNTK